jgi:hypothetical protein
VQLYAIAVKDCPVLTKNPPAPPAPAASLLLDVPPPPPPAITIISAVND